MKETGDRSHFLHDSAHVMISNQVQPQRQIAYALLGAEVVGTGRDNLTGKGAHFEMMRLLELDLDRDDG